MAGIPEWIDAVALLGTGEWSRDADGFSAALPPDVAADLAARLRGVGLGGQALAVSIQPRLKRTVVRAGRTRDARARRNSTPGFHRPGVRLDPEGRWSLTPEDLAMAMARPWSDQPVVDLSCGAGGNCIALARCGCRVTAVDRDPKRIALARHNARIYGVEGQIRFVVGDALDHAAGEALRMVDPPWGLDWDRHRTTIDDLPLLADVLTRATGPVLAKVPPSFDPTTVPGATPRAWFGQASGDRHRVKCVTLTVDASRGA